MGDLAGRPQNKAGDLSSRTRDRASQLGSQARQQASRASGGFQRMLNDNPLTDGALGVGAAIGLAIPETSKEHEVMGEARDTVVEKAQEMQQSVQRVAEEAQGAAPGRRPRTRASSRPSRTYEAQSWARPSLAAPAAF